MKKYILSTLLITLPLFASADEIEINHIYYNVVKKAHIAEVVSYNNDMLPYNWSINIPETITCEGGEYVVTKIADNAFSNCINIVSLTLSNSITNIGKASFKNCTRLASVSIGNSILSIESEAFYGCSGLNKVIVNDIAAWCGIVFSDGLSNPLIYAKHLYSDANTEIKDLTIPNTVSHIGNSTFHSCVGLNSVTIPNSVTSIGDYAFYGCIGLKDITIPNSVSYIGFYTFKECNGLEKVIVGDIESWCRITFYGWYSNPLEYAHHLFSDENTEITSLVIPSSITNIGNYVFSGYSSLSSVTIPNSVTSIGKGSFDGCSGLVSVTIPNSVTNIGNFAFSYCTGLTTVTIPNSVASIGASSFQYCAGLTSVTIPNSVTSIEISTFYGCTGLTSVIIPNSVTNIGEWAFCECSELTSVIIPNTVTNIGSEAFNGCRGLTSVTIGNSAKKIGGLAFANCQNIEEVYCYAENVPNTNSNVFEGSYPEYATLYVPEASLSKYETTVPWSYFGTKLPIEGTGVTQMKVSVPIVQAESGNIFVSGIGESDRITVYLTDGKQVATAKAQNGTASIATNISKGTPVFVKIGDKAVKVMMR